ncbi:MAG: transposase [Desulfohalobiaceae bacterium]
MILTHYENLIKSRKTAQRFLLEFCWKNHQRFCPRCRCRKLYNLSSGKRRCSRCKYTFHDFSLRFINYSQLSCRQWLRFLKLFELEVGAEQMAKQLDISYNTVRKAQTICRLAILAHSLYGPQLIRTLSLFSLLSNQEHGREQNPVLGIQEADGHVFVDCLPQFGMESLLYLHLDHQLQTKSAGHVLYTDSYKQYTGLLIYDTGLFARYKVQHNSSAFPLERYSHFWCFVQPRLQHFKVLNPVKLLLYLKELEFRYNHRQEDIFRDLALRICSFVPSLE